MAVEDYASDDSMSNLEAVSNSDSKNEPTSGVVADHNWFSDVVNERAPETECSEGSDWDFDDLFKNSMPAVDAPFALEVPGALKHVAALISASSNAGNTSHTKVYDSGCTSHISPYRNDFKKFIDITSMSF